MAAKTNARSSMILLLGHRILLVMNGSTSSTEFEVGADRFEDLEIRPSDRENFHYFYDVRRRSLIKRFLLGESPQRKVYCEVKLIQKEDRFTPRLAFSIRNAKDEIVKEGNGGLAVKARVDLSSHHEHIWELIAWISSLTDIDVPGQSFSLVTADDASLIGAIRSREPSSKATVVKALAGDISFSESEIRSGTWSLGKGMLDGLAQLQANCDTWEKEGSRTEENRERFDASGIHTVEPKGILVVGNLDQIKQTPGKYRTFQRFRAALHGTEILTFDELYERASFIVSDD